MHSFTQPTYWGIVGSAVHAAEVDDIGVDNTGVAGAVLVSPFGCREFAGLLLGSL